MGQYVIGEYVGSYGSEIDEYALLEFQKENKLTTYYLEGRCNCNYCDKDSFNMWSGEVYYDENNSKISLTEISNGESYDLEIYICNNCGAWYDIGGPL